MKSHYNPINISNNNASNEKVINVWGSSSSEKLCTRKTSFVVPKTGVAQIRGSDGWDKEFPQPHCSSLNEK